MLERWSALRRAELPGGDIITQCFFFRLRRAVTPLGIGDTSSYGHEGEINNIGLGVVVLQSKSFQVSPDIFLKEDSITVCRTELMD